MKTIYHFRPAFIENDVEISILFTKSLIKWIKGFNLIIVELIKTGRDDMDLSKAVQNFHTNTEKNCDVKIGS